MSEELMLLVQVNNSFKESVKSLQKSIDEEISWTIFIEYCNTSCWRYRCD